MIDLTTLAAAKAYTDKKCGGVEKTVLFDGKPTRTDLTSMGMGYAYLLSNEDLFSLAKGQNVHYEYTLADGTAAHGVLEEYGYLSSLAAPMVVGAFTFMYAPALGGSGVSFNYTDMGEITNIKLWTEYSENKPYYLRYVRKWETEGKYVTLPYEIEKAVSAERSGYLFIRLHGDEGDRPFYVGRSTMNGVERLEVLTFSKTYIHPDFHLIFNQMTFSENGSNDSSIISTVLANNS